MKFLLALCVAFSAVGAAPAQIKPLILQSVQVSAEGGAVVVVLEADGPLPAPSTGQVDSPPRFFLDFQGVIAGTRGTRQGSGPVKAVRVALNSSNPPVTRVVVDLAQRRRVEVDAAAREQGRIRLIIGGAAQDQAGAEPPAAERPSGTSEGNPAALIPIPLASSGAAVESQAPSPVPGVEPVPELPPPPNSSAEKPATPATPPEDLPPPAVYPVNTAGTAPQPSRDDLNRFREQVLPSLDRLRARRPMLTEIDRQDSTPPAGLAEARSEFSSVIRTLAALRPPDTLRGTHDMLLRAASFSMMAATLRADAGTRADPTAVRNAASAAAGALLLLDRVCIEIGCTDASDRK